MSRRNTIILGFLIILAIGFLIFWFGKDNDRRETNLVPETQSQTTPSSRLFFDVYEPSDRVCKVESVINAEGSAAQFQTAAPRTKRSLQAGEDIGLRNKFGTAADTYEYKMSLYQPSGRVAIASGLVTGSEWSFNNIPKDFVGLTLEEGVYDIEFRIGGKIVACDSFRVVAE